MRFFPASVILEIEPFFCPNLLPQNSTRILGNSLIFPNFFVRTSFLMVTKSRAGKKDSGRVGPAAVLCQTLSLARCSRKSSWWAPQLGE